jgi:hypothetical protein
MKTYFISINEDKAQTAVEYMLLLTSVVAIVLVGLRVYLPRIQETSNIYYNRVSYGIMGSPSTCGDGYCDTTGSSTGNPPLEDCSKCPDDCGIC